MIPRSSTPRWLGPLVVVVGAIGLVLHARTFDYFCDDAFIALRYSKNFAELGEPIYNLGERVEGYTSFAWMAMTAAFMRLGVEGPAAAQRVGALSAFLLVASTWWLWRVVEPRRPAVGVLLVGAIVTSAPIAAWTLGGLETPLFAALVTASVAATAWASGRGTYARGVVAGGVLAAATLSRPEGAALFAVVVLAVGALALRQRHILRALVGLVGTYVLLVGAFVAWRFHYYGDLLPNTFYLKMSGHRAQMIQHGIRYVRLALSDFGEPLTQVLLLGLFVPARVALAEPAATTRARRLALWTSRLFVLVLVPYVVWIGGDFLDLYRFLVPIFPLVFVAVALAACRIVESFTPGRPRVAAAAILFGITLLPYSARQPVISRRARSVSDARRAHAGVEPIGWSRLYALRWAAMGRWIAAHAQPDDWMATGAAGAMPYYAGIRNLDRLGLCDAWVARHGNAMGDRPGHQREAPEWYTLSKKPVFLFINDNIDTTLKPLKRDEKWEAKGYVQAVVTLDERYGAPGKFYYRFLLRIDRAVALMGEPDLQTALGMP